ncbi:LytR C-terminal domain-containing protein [[Clostridium] polysaccharolyticum]|uniref:LytR cell envelope-related transcriptional attenuator n=1 Tax=[Clostridium] polysaccharolyticum TaxID=29364 RepID=A0A1I0FYQ7_9FIRM|nr:LytR C-terminal domain-containing protein [[Clostridium] polysaccharolyticum]SET63700.1 LytR cell envelope-related transcriptional attenuator [[Clostridium] polysaccharolyticum]
MKKKSGKIFLRDLAKAFFSVFALTAIFLASYKVTGLYLEKNGGHAAGRKIHMEREGKLDSISFQLLFSLNEANKELEHVVLEVFNTKTDCLMYMTIPMNAKLSMSQRLYMELFKKNKDIPQIISFDSIKEYVNPAGYYDFGAALIDDALGLDISYYTIVPSEVFDDVFVEQDGYLTLTDDVLGTVKNYNEQEIDSYMRNFCRNVKSNLSLEKRLTYTPALSKVVWEDVIYNLIPGESDSDSYSIDKEKADAIWKAMEDNYAAEEIKGLLGQAQKVSLDKNIMIYNGSGINGLAGNVQKKLESEGYTINGIGNYTSSDVQETIIQVTQEGLGKDLIAYFKKAVIEKVENMPNGVDIQIVLGKSESAS